ncbi:Cytoskeleton-associated protein, Gly-rich domain protein [Cordyceps fumosorosea ARSEF 2679]|uniref:Cytoskeleton-associated protein, Gly-rich domain protein n=1 Tax=Cordyceps fumosorosea (strain ARSEF 2679) TaxID=1081104 RepID=A0A167ZHS0_CORFA|nr:Cytoskeleton-associated protein, Gly-rich domain protein [Cordyceps fumosorosea ARSEF 2679]OAA67533.1 Cytoskeleton-associated protein, Gly-rich domain protein [Cordyceps fumosorosea ARSEF 2679]
MADSHYLGERISYDDALCTVRYIGEVAGATGSWLGVEWDDGTRGKHDGSHKGRRYFQCKCTSDSPTAASFVRPTRPADAPVSFVTALKAKYVEAESATSGVPDSRIRFAGKVAEEVGFDKVRRQMAQLDELRTAILDGVYMAVAHSQGEPTVAQVSPKLSHIDISRNLFENLGPVVDICKDLPGLKKLAIKYVCTFYRDEMKAATNSRRISGNRFQNVVEDNALVKAVTAFSQVTELGIGDNMLGWEEICRIAVAFPSLTNLAAGANYLSSLPAVNYSGLSTTLTTLNLEFNSFGALSDLASLAPLTSLRNLYLKGNNIRSLSSEDAPCPVFSKSIQYIDVSYNQIEDWDFIDRLTEHVPGLTALRISHNPVYDVGASSSSAAAATTADEAHMFTIARIGALQTLNFSPVTADDRNNAELFYLSRIARQLAAAPEAAAPGILAAHPRYEALCAKHGAPDVVRAVAANPAFLEARLVTMALRCAGRADRMVRVPQALDVYAVKARVARAYGLSPLRLRLVWETGEWDPVARRRGDDVDTSDEEDEAEDGATEDAPVEKLAHDQPGRWVKREVELRDGPRQLGYCVDGLDVKIRVEPL